jgi:hypothetical protein
MKVTSIRDFRFSGFTDPNGSEKIFLSGPFDNSVVMATREEAALIAQQLQHCCLQPTYFAMKLASGDHVSISRWGDWIVVQLAEVKMLLDPTDSLDLSEQIMFVWLEFRRPSPIAA